jgi:6-phosphogluconate dehydrogenase (decarboxylating)
VRYHASTEIADARFTSAARLEEIEAELVSAGAADVSFEIVSGVLVGVGFSIKADTIDRAWTRVEEILWAASLERVGPLDIAELGSGHLVKLGAL